MTYFRLWLLCIYSFFLCFTPSIQADDEPVIVIGAGIAGLSAARELKTQGIPVILLEARNRPGGRISTFREWGADMELGAAWIHEYEGNPLTALCRRFNVSIKDNDYRNNVFIDQDGKRLAGSESIGRLSDSMMSFRARCLDFERTLDQDISVVEAMEQLLPGLSSFDRLAANWWVSWDLETDNGSDTR